MRLYPQMYPGNSIPRPETGSSGNVTSAWKAVASRTLVVRSNMRAGNVPESGLNFGAIEREARAAQSAWIASTLHSYFESLVRKLRVEPKIVDATAAALNNAKKKAA